MSLTLTWSDLYERSIDSIGALREIWHVELKLDQKIVLLVTLVFLLLDRFIFSGPVRRWLVVAMRRMRGFQLHPDLYERAEQHFRLIRRLWRDGLFLAVRFTLSARRRLRYHQINEQVKAASGAATFVIFYTLFVGTNIEPVQEVSHSIAMRLPFCKKEMAQNKLVDREWALIINGWNEIEPVGPESLAENTRADDEPAPCRTEVLDIVVKLSAGSHRLSERFLLQLIANTAIAIWALLFLPHSRYGVAERRMRGRFRHIVPLNTFVIRTQAMMLGLLLILPIITGAWLEHDSTRPGGGDSIATIAAAAISPLTFDAEQNLKTIADYVPSGARETLVRNIEHVSNVLHVIAAASALLLLVILEITKETIIKPVFRDGLLPFRSPGQGGGINWRRRLRWLFNRRRLLRGPHGTDNHDRPPQ